MVGFSIGRQVDRYTFISLEPDWWLGTICLRIETNNRNRVMEPAGFDIYTGSVGLRRQSKNRILSSNGEVFFLLTNPLIIGDP
jgi:hypothetical protein